MTAPVEAKASRPSAPPSSVPLLLPVIAMVAGTAVVSLVAGQVPILWGALVGAVLAGGLRWVGLLRSPGDGAIVVAAAALGLWIVWTAVDSRSGLISLEESFRAAGGWLIVGAGFSYAIWRADRGLGLPAALVAALAWGVAAVAIFEWATDFGFLAELRAFEVEAGEIQPISDSFYAWVGSLIVALGVTAALSLHVATPTLATISASLVFTVFAANTISFSFGELVSQFGRFGDLAEQFWPPQWTWADFQGLDPELQILEPMIETLQIAIVGATLGCGIAIPIAFLASRPTTYNGPAYWLARTIMNVLRTIPDLFWGIFFATAVSFGSPFAGALAMIMFSMTIMAKLFSETIDTIDPGPLEAAKASGARQSQVIQTSAMPQVLPNYVAYALYIFELNIRASVVIGLVGAGGIGLLLNEQRTFFQWDRVMAIVLVIFGAVVLIEAVSIAIRRKLV